MTSKASAKPCRVVHAVNNITIDRMTGIGMRVVGVVAIWLACCGSLAVAQRVHTTNRWHNVLDRPGDWYGTDDARRIADNVLLYQHDNGGWPKNINMARVLSDDEKAEIAAKRNTFDTLIDNGATYTQLQLLGRVVSATDEAKYRDAFYRGLDYVLAAQYDNGGWPMFYPRRRGYYEHITFNDGSMVGVLRLLRDVSSGEPPFAFVDQEHRQRTEAAIARGIQAILDCQVVVDGRRTAWCAQHHYETLEPAKARSYELPSLSGSESVGIVRFLMEIPSPSQEVIEAVEGAVAWFDEAKISGIRLKRVPHPEARRGYDYVVEEDPSAGPMWARFYEIGTNRPMFVGRDGVIKDHLADIELERRTGYSYLGTWPRSLLEKDYPAWRRRLGE